MPAVFLELWWLVGDGSGELSALLVPERWLLRVSAMCLACKRESYLGTRELALSPCRSLYHLLAGKSSACLAVKLKAGEEPPCPN